MACSWLSSCERPCYAGAHALRRGLLKLTASQDEAMFLGAGCRMKRWDPESVIGVLFVAMIFIAVLATIGWMLWSAVNDHRDQSRCRDRGGNVEHLIPTGDWRCVGAQLKGSP